MPTVIDTRTRNVQWLVTKTVTAVLTVRFYNAAGTALNVSSYTFAARHLDRPGGTATSLTVGTGSAASGIVTVTADNSVLANLSSGVWSLIWTVGGEPSAGIGGRFTIDPEGARGAPQTGNGTEVSVTIGDDDAVDVTVVASSGAASTVTVTPSGNLAATDVQAALIELQSDVDTRAIGSVVAGVAGSRPSVLGGHASNAIASDIIAGVITGGGTTNRENVIGGQYDNVNTSDSNLPTVLGTVANYSSIEGGYDNVANGLMSVIHGAHNRTHQDSTHGSIGGGSSHSISDGDYGTIGGGLENNLSGNSSTIVGGRENTVNAHNSVAGGFQNTINVGADGSVALGTQNTVTVQGVAIGVDCDVEATSSTALGRRSRTRTYGQVAQAADYFASPGDAQSSVLTLRVQTTNATETVCGTTGTTNSHILLASQVVGYRIMLVAREDATGDCKMWEIVGAMKRPAVGNNTHVGGSAPTPTVIVQDAGASAWTCRVDISTNILVLRVTGEASHTIRWCARMELVEVGTF